MFTIDRNRRSPSTGMSVHDRLELVFTIRRNAQRADSGDREQSVHSIMNTDSGDHEHLFAPA
jgi:hypothetical protein